jgi:hypothetical protein
MSVKTQAIFRQKIYKLLMSYYGVYVYQNDNLLTAVI